MKDSLYAFVTSSRIIRALPGATAAAQSGIFPDE